MSKVYPGSPEYNKLIENLKNMKLTKLPKISTIKIPIQEEETVPIQEEETVPIQEEEKEVKKYKIEKDKQLKGIDANPWSFFDDIAWLMVEELNTAEIYDAEIDDYVLLDQADPSLLNRYNNLDLGKNIILSDEGQELKMVTLKLPISDKLFIRKTLTGKKITPKFVLEELEKFVSEKLPMIYAFDKKGKKVKTGRFKPIEYLGRADFGGFAKEKDGSYRLKLL